MADTIFQILQWAIPSGGIGAAIAWIAEKKTRDAKTAKEVHDTYKAMYEDISALLVETQKKYEETKEQIETLGTENSRTRRALNRLSRAIEAIQICPHRHSTKKLTQESRSEQSTELTDSELVDISETRVQPVKVPMSSVSLTLNLDSLRLLPLGAGYTARQGQANLKIRRKAPSTTKSGQSTTEPGQIVIEASCDSLELVCSSLTKTVSTLKKRLARQQKVGEFKYEEKKTESPFNTVLTAFKWLLIGFVTGLILSKIKAIILFIKRKIRI